jgi:hypothetical protein
MVFEENHYENSRDRQGFEPCPLRHIVDDWVAAQSLYGQALLEGLEPPSNWVETSHSNPLSYKSLHERATITPPLRAGAGN